MRWSRATALLVGALPSVGCAVGLSSNQPAHVAAPGHAHADFRFAASDTFFDEADDLTLYPILQFGLLLRPAQSWTFFIESDLAGGLTTVDFGDSALMFYPSAGVSFAWGTPSERVR